MRKDTIDGYNFGKAIKGYYDKDSVQRFMKLAEEEMSQVQIECENQEVSMKQLDSEMNHYQEDVLQIGMTYLEAKRLISEADKELEQEHQLLIAEVEEEFQRQKQALEDAFMNERLQLLAQVETQNDSLKLRIMELEDEQQTLQEESERLRNSLKSNLRSSTMMMKLRKEEQTLKSDIDSPGKFRLTNEGQFVSDAHNSKTVDESSKVFTLKELCV